ncbi:NACAD protein, partial [Chaetops frenatus]|nr:NACAD protein [Chaetops frenatus]
YMTAEGGSWGSSGTASTSPSCSPNLAAEAEGLGEAEGEAEGLGGVLALPPGLGDPPAFPPLSPEEDDDEDDDDEDGPFAPPGCADDEDEDDDEDGQTPEEEDEDEDEGSGLIPAALLPFRGSLLFQAEAVEISPRAPAEEEEEEEEDEGSTSASFLRSLSESSIPEGGDEAFAFRDDTDASSDSAAYDGDEDERLYGTERHAGDTGTPPGTPPAPAGVELHLRAGSPCHPAGQDAAPAALGTPLAPPGGDAELDGHAFVTIPGVWPLPEPPEEVAVTECSGAALGHGPCPELALTGPVPRPPALCAGDPQSHQLGGANGEPQDGPAGDSDGDNDLELSTEPVGSADGHSELDSAATALGTSVTPTGLDEMDAVANDVVT